VTARPIGLDDVPDLLRQCERLFLQGTSGEPLALHAVADVQGDAFSHLSALTSFVAGLNRFDRAAPRAVRDVAGFFPAGSGGPEAYRQIVATYSGVVAEIDRFAPDVVFVPVSLPDSSGRVSTGLCAEFYDVAMATASCRVALMCTDLPMLPAATRSIWRRLPILFEMTGLHRRGRKVRRPLIRSRMRSPAMSLALSATAVRCKLGSGEFLPVFSRISPSGAGSDSTQDC
jgi:hypothetical protein